CSWYGSVRSDCGKVGEQIQGARDEDRAVCAGQRTRLLDSLRRVRDGLHGVEETPGFRGQLVDGQGTRIGGLRRNEGVAEGRQRGEHSVDVLVRENRGDDDIAAGGEEAAAVAAPPQTDGA